MVSSASYYHGAMKRQLLISADRNNEIGHTHLLLLIAIFSRFMTYVIRLFTRYYEHRMMLQRIIQLLWWLHRSFSCCNQYRFYNAQIPKIYSLPSSSLVLFLSGWHYWHFEKKLNTHKFGGSFYSGAVNQNGQLDPLSDVVFWE